MFSLPSSAQLNPHAAKEHHNPTAALGHPCSWAYPTTRPIRWPGPGRMRLHTELGPGKGLQQLTQTSGTSPNRTRATWEKGNVPRVPDSSQGRLKDCCPGGRLGTVSSPVGSRQGLGACSRYFLARTCPPVQVGIAAMRVVPAECSKSCQGRGRTLGGFGQLGTSSAALLDSGSWAAPAVGWCPLALGCAWSSRLGFTGRRVDAVYRISGVLGMAPLGKDKRCSET